MSYHQFLLFAGLAIVLAFWLPRFVSGRINGEFATVDWVPIRYVNQGHSRDELSGIYRAAKVGLVTPLRDGMNLVAKEYVAAQNPDDPGVLVLSCFAGAAAQLTVAVIVNAHSAEDVADGIARALAMPLAERIARHRALLGKFLRTRRAFGERACGISSSGGGDACTRLLVGCLAVVAGDGRQQARRHRECNPHRRFFPVYARRGGVRAMVGARGEGEFT